MILRLPINVKLYSEQDQVVRSINSTKKSQVRLRVDEAPVWSYGICRIWYNRPEDVWNEFRFTTLAQLDTGLTVNTEKDLIDNLSIPAEYLEKRKLTPAQRRSIAKARKSSGMKTGGTS